MAYQQGDYHQARQLLEDNLLLRRQMNDRWGIALALNTLSSLARDTGAHDRACLYLEQALQLAQEIQSTPMVKDKTLSAITPF